MDAVRELVSSGQKKGFLTYGEIADALNHLDLNAQQIDDVYKRFTDMGIEVVSGRQAVPDHVLYPGSKKSDGDDSESVSVVVKVMPAVAEAPNDEEVAEAESSEESTEIDLSIPEGVALDDPVRMYLKEIGRVSLLTADVWRWAIRAPREGSSRQT